MFRPGKDKALDMNYSKETIFAINEVSIVVYFCRLFYSLSKRLLIYGQRVLENQGGKKKQRMNEYIVSSFSPIRGKQVYVRFTKKKLI